MSYGERILKEIGHFSNEDILLFDNKLVKKTFRKQEILLSEGQLSDRFFFITKGTAYQFVYEDIDENIIGLHIEGDWCFNHTSFVKQQPSAAIIKAYTDLEVIMLTAASIHELIALSAAFFQLGRVLEESVSRVQYFDKASTALEKYNHLFETRPALFQQFPLKMIGAYLKIAPETLSRIRTKK